jgi:hypothetical protein
MVRTCFFLLLSCVLFSCSDKYSLYKNQYSFKSDNGSPQFADLDYWAAHPWKKDPSDSIPEPLRGQVIDSSADVFFLYPTSFTTRKELRENAGIDDAYLNAKTDYSSILYQASVFNQSCRIFAPRYRQANITMFFTTDSVKANQAFDLAYEDISTAFEYYLQHWNNNRPVIIASHSQGSKLAERLLKDYFEDKPLRRQLVVAYIPGWPVPKDYFTSLKMCEDSLQTGCICSWRTLRKGYLPAYLKNENGNAFATNPLTWKINTGYAPRSLNKGSVLLNFNKIYTQTTGAQVLDGLLFIRKPKFPGGFFYFRRNYHIADFNLFYMNIRENVLQRIHSFNK